MKTQKGTSGRTDREHRKQVGTRTDTGRNGGFGQEAERQQCGTDRRPNDGNPRETKRQEVRTDTNPSGHRENQGTHQGKPVEFSHLRQLDLRPTQGNQGTPSVGSMAGEVKAGLESLMAGDPTAGICIFHAKHFDDTINDPEKFPKTIKYPREYFSQV